MIYDGVEAKDSIQQGDIFIAVPRVELSLSTLPVFDEGSDSPRKTNWQEVSNQPAVTAMVALKPVVAIVVTQNCDAKRGEYISLSQIDPFLEVLGQATPPRNATKWKDLIIRTSNTNARYFYLPADKNVGFEQAMAADLRVLLRVPRLDLDELKSKCRVGRLNALAVDHFREKLAYFFRRHAFDEWYPLTPDEFRAYAGGCDEAIEPFPWQR